MNAPEPSPSLVPGGSDEQPTAGWHSIQVHYRKPDITPLLLDAVRPLFNHLAPHVEAQYYMPHWRRGPHVRLQFKTTQEQFDHVVRPSAQRLIGHYLRDHPSTEPYDEAAELRIHERLAFTEWETGPLTPFHPDNSVQFEPFDDRKRILGSDDAVELLGWFHARSTPLAFQILSEAPERSQRLAVAFDLMAATSCLVFSVERTANSYRSHSEAFIATSSDPDRTRAHLDRQFVPRAAALRDRLAAVVAAVEADSDTFAHVQQWSVLVRELHQRGTALLKAGRISFNGTDTEREDLDEKAMTEEFFRRSPFHRSIDPAQYRELLATVEYQAYRLVINSQYLLMTRIGLRPADRFTLCHLVAGAGESFSGSAPSVPVGQRADS
ncbi:thiopeptide maturation pyridine synthase [Streptomyces cadmiisoli]|uniref:thiopeptide maturation pyridine synthase n=1 Tax=Streptomyces cadmiisoli TaxID=2184053 RepID=UPI003D719ACB